MAVITTLTPEQEAAIPTFINKWIDQAAKPTDREAATKAVKAIYKKMGEEPPLVIFGRSPIEAFYMAALVGLETKDHGQFYTQLGQLNGQLNAQLRDQLYLQLDQLGQLDQLHAQLSAQLGQQLGQQPDQLRAQFGQLRAQLYTQLGQLNGQLNAQLRGQLDQLDQLDAQLDDQLHDQLHDQLREQLHEQLDQLDGRFSAQLGQLDGQLYTQLRAQLGQQPDQLADQLRAQLGQLDQLDAQLDDQLNAQLRDQLDQLRDQLESLRSSYYFSGYWLSWCGLYDYAEYIGVEFDNDSLSAFRDFAANVGFIIPLKGIAFLSEAPTRIVWSQSGLLHWDHGQAVEYADGWGLHMLHGVRFTKEEYDQIMSGEFTMADMVNIGSTEKAAAAMQMLTPEKLIEGFDAKLVATGTKYALLRKMYGDDYCREHMPYAFNEETRLYVVEDFTGKAERTNEKTGDTEYCMIMQHPSVGHSKYLQWVHPEVGAKHDADLAQAASREMPVEDYLIALEA